MFRKHHSTRSMFEARFPVPAYLLWDGMKYVAKWPECDRILARHYTSKYIGFVACYKMATGIDTLNKYKFCRFWK